jgi:hypothetical protein
LGDNWDIQLAKAQRNSRVTVILVSSATEEAFYAREEIAIAIRESRSSKNQHRLVPLFLDSQSLSEPPYGLALKHGISLVNGKSLEDAAKALSDLLTNVERAD